ncbi:MAG: TetR/AcrR family transcriptional regulator [Gammaproteobacteria bacterium]|nr:TetR/AcrR family transcriptional regulator [Gammaproteobacteria bacterium]
MDVIVRKPLARRSHAERTAQAETKLVDAAVALIIERGIGGMTLKDVGELAGYSRAMAGWRYGSKASLCAYVVRAVGDEWIQALQQAVQDKVGLAAIHAATDAHYRFVRTDAARIRAFYLLWFDSIGPDLELKQVIVNIHARRQRDVEAWIKSGIAHGLIRADADVSGVAAQFCATIIGVVYQWLVTPTARHAIKALHEGLKQQMTRALIPLANAVSAPRLR